jgi:pyruvate/2-oxoglutarate/acetoin dehydrogenase E1 component
MATKNYADAMLDVLGTMMEEDPTFAVIGNEVLGIGPEAPQFAPFQERYGDRCYFPPCSEAAFAALAAGAAMCGQQIFTHLGLASFSYPAFSSIANEIAPAHLSSGGRIKVPVVLHISHGLLHGGGAQHSESPLSTYWNIPGIEIAVPSGAREVKGLLRTAFASENPTMVITHAFLYGAEDDVPDEDYEIPFGEAAVPREGGDVTIVGCSMMVSLAMQAAEQLAADGIEAEVIDLRTLVPLDEETILASVAKTGRLVIADEGRLRAGVASEIAATVSERGFDSLKAPVARVARADAPVSNSQPQEAFISPTVEKVVEAAKRLSAELPAAASS